MTTLLEAARVVSSLIANRPLGGYWPELSRALTDLANEIAAAESAPAVVTADEVFAVLVESPLCRPGIERGEVAVAAGQVALMFAERTAAAVAAERREEHRDAMFAARSAREAEREACARVADEHAAHERVPTPIAEATRRESLRVAAAIRARGQSEAPAPAASTAALDAADLDRLIAAIEAVVDRLHSGGPIVEHLEQADTDALHELWKCQLIATRLRDREARVQALVEAAEGMLRWLDTSTGLPSETALRAALDALGKEGA